MPHAVHSSGTANPVLDVELTIATVTTLGVYSMQIDLTEMQAGDTLALRRYQRDADGGSYVLAEEHILSDAQTEDIVEYLPIHSGYGTSWRLEQTDGVARDFQWVLKEIT